jgi:TonB family protein
VIVAILQSSIVLFIALAAIVLLRRKSAAVRHAVLSVGLIASLVVPFIPRLVPESSRREGVSAAVQTPGRISVTPGKNARPLRFPIVASSSIFFEVFFWIWALGASIAGGILASGIASVVWLGFQSRPFSRVEWSRAARQISERLRIRRRLHLVQNNGAVLGAWGLLRPKIFLPVDADEWQEDRIHAVLTHELAHIKRCDWLVQITAEFARAVYWFNPLYWMACHQLRSESEHACDDVVLSAGIDAKDYAAHLLDLARALKHSNRAWPPVLAMSRPPHLERRIVAMLNPSLNHGAAGRGTAPVLCAVAVVVMLSLSAMRAPAEAAHPVQFAASPAQIAAATAAPASPAPATPAMPRKVTTAPAPLPRQGRAGGILSGTVLDASGARLPGVTVTVSARESVEFGIRETPVATAISDETGSFQFNTLPEGQYSLRADLPGFATFRKAAISIKPSETVRENVRLSIGRLAEQIQVTAAGSPRPPVPPSTPQRLRVGGNVVAARLISQVKPVYPQAAQDAGIEGVAHLEGIIGTEGTFILLRVVASSDRDLGNAALEAVRQWRYQPTMLNGEPIEVQTEIDVEFKLMQ